MTPAQKIISTLDLEVLDIEGGFFKELYRGKHGTSIYYLLEKAQISCWHKVKSDEIWYFHAGTAARQMLIFPDGSSAERIIGADISAGQAAQSVIPANTWQAAKLISQNSGDYGLFGAAVFPAFEYSDFAGASAAGLARQYPELKEKIMQFE